MRLTPLKHPPHGGDIYKADGRLEDLIDFSVNVNEFNDKKRIYQIITENLELIKHYPDPNCTLLRHEIAELFNELDKEIKREKERSGQKLLPSNFLFGNGAMELLDLIGYTFIEKGTKVFIITPTFMEYSWIAKKYGGSVCPYYLEASQNFNLELSSLFKFMEKELKNVSTSESKEDFVSLLFICNPNNPTGRLYSETLIRKLARFCKEHRILLCIDESFIFFTDQERLGSKLIREFENALIIRSFTKILGIPGIRLGMVMGNKELIELLHSNQIPWNTNIFAQQIGRYFIQKHVYLQYLYKVKERYKQLRESLIRDLSFLSRLKIFRSEANFILIDIRGYSVSAKELKDNLIRRGILIRDCSDFDGLDKYYIRVAVKNEKQNGDLVYQLKEILKKSP